MKTLWAVMNNMSLLKILNLKSDRTDLLQRENCNSANLFLKVITQNEIQLRVSFLIFLE